MILRLPIFHSASGYVYFFLDMADGEILKVQRIAQYYSIAELFVYYCYFRAGSALWHPHYVFHIKLPSDMWFWKLRGKIMLFVLLQNPAKYSPRAFSPNLNINKICDCLPQRILNELCVPRALLILHQTMLSIGQNTLKSKWGRKSFLENKTLMGDLQEL